MSTIFFLTGTASTSIYTLSLHDALPIFGRQARAVRQFTVSDSGLEQLEAAIANGERSEEHTSELQSDSELVCRLLLEKKKKKIVIHALVNYQSSYLYHSQNVTHL